MQTRSVSVANSHVLKWWDDPVSSSVPKANRPVDTAARAVARTNAEITAFTCQRLQAMVGAPARLARCCTPYDLMTEQIAYWQTAMDQYNTASQAVIAAWSPLMPWLAAVPTVSPSVPSRPLPEALQRFLAPSQPIHPVRDMLTLDQPSPERQRAAA